MTAKRLSILALLLLAACAPDPGRSATQTAAALTASRGDGIYLVGVDIALGEWQSTPGPGESCFWFRRKASGVILGSYYGAPGSAMRIQPVDYEVEMTGCGTWTYLGP